MLKLIREVLRVGDATLPYPFAPMEMMPGFRGKPVHDPQLCIACAACAIACPSNALSMVTDLDQGYQSWSFIRRSLHLLRALRGSLPDRRHYPQPEFRAGGDEQK